MIASLDGAWGASGLWVYIGVVVIMFGFAALMTGQAVARGWGSAWKAAAYAVLLSMGARFVVWSLFNGVLWSVPAFVVDGAILVPLAVLAHRATMARMMVTQYPWLYAPSGPFGWREIQGTRELASAR